MNREWSRYYRQPALCDFDVLHARFIDHQFARHSHEYYVIGVVEGGVQAFAYRGAHHVTPAGQIFIVDPGESHDGGPATVEGYIHRAVYPRLELMQRVAGEVVGSSRLPSFARAVLRDDKLARQLLRFHRVVAEGASSLSVESHLMGALAHLIQRHGDTRCVGSRSRELGERSAVRTAREYIDAHYATNVSLSELATLVRLSPFYFARAFCQEVGLPPHAYLETVRVRKARELLLRGLPIAEVSIAVGYGDQSHFTHRFKRLLGITPGQVARNRTQAPSVRD